MPDETTRASRLRDPDSCIASRVVLRVPGRLALLRGDGTARDIDDGFDLMGILRAMDRELADLDGPTEYAVVSPDDVILYSTGSPATAVAYLTGQDSGTRLIALRS